MPLPLCLWLPYLSSQTHIQPFCSCHECFWSSENCRGTPPLSWCICDHQHHFKVHTINILLKHMSCAGICMVMSESESEGVKTLLLYPIWYSDYTWVLGLLQFTVWREMVQHISSKWKIIATIVTWQNIHQRENSYTMIQKYISATKQKRTFSSHVILLSYSGYLFRVA